MATEKTYVIEGVDCAVCAQRIEKAIDGLDGVCSSTIDLLQNRLRITTDHGDAVDLDELIHHVVSREEPGTKVYPFTTAQSQSDEEQNQLPGYKRYAIPLRVASAIIIVIATTAMESAPLSLGLYLLAYAISGYEIVLKALRNLFKGNMFDENFLMTLATIGAFIIGEYAEAVAVMAFYQVGEFFQDLAVDRSRRSIAKLMDIKPLSATIIRHGTAVSVKPEEIVIGDTLLIKPGEKIPVDAKVTDGQSSLDTRALTGETMPREVSVGDTLLSGSVNGSGVLHAEATTRYVDSTVASILKLVEESSQKKAKTERFITKFARYYTPVVVGLAVLIAFLPPLIGLGTLSTWTYRALVFLVVSCPCALVISVPLGFFGGIGGLSRMGILIKGGNHIQTLADTRHVVFDKTGTITKGTFSVDGISVVESSTYTADEIMAYADAIESRSNHPIAQAVEDYAKRLPSRYQATGISEVAGRGMRGKVDAIPVAVGTDIFMEELGFTVPQFPGKSGGPTVLVAVDNKVVGRITLSDTIKEESAKAVAQLRNLGVDRISMLSGDTAETVETTAKAVGIDSYWGNLLPQDKIERMESFMEQKRKREKVLFVGDGINDAPVLAQADIGASMGMVGSDAAVEASDMVIMTDDLSRIPQGIRHARKTVSIVTQNIVFALAIKVLVMALGTVGLATMWLAVFADTGVALLAVLNSLRALKYD